ncbi:Fcf2 pre-rRNA processing-domain-containing protein [Emericellopsis atlantica]|uniref:Fcf2 pre-rRNA processing-domain-containing protein n=1 Tax=Emericellopsis atlantica TaxID=2614577 RepID=A0A9P7ZIK4_9HYPO|nr:Fcf2 pre-rRNA processing-domain-containing protein [Emericellopsis atlantica]KAG9252744.1 Fcf2 pre-rRNA processing-domain-containing protein [Emericellopsis atlantica]
MTSLADIDLDGLLREAESRLSKTRTSQQIDNKPPLSGSLTSVPSRGAAPREALSVRQIQTTKTPTEDTAGKDWFHLPKADATSELKRDWQILRMRNVLDPKQQRKALRPEIPKYAQVGEIVAGPTDFYSARMTRKERKHNLLQEALDSRDESKMRHKYANIQHDKTSGKKGSYRKFLSQRKKFKG